MRPFLVLASVIAASSVMSAEAHAVCNIRGQWCDYPAWAANAFTNPRDRVPDYVLEGNAHRDRAYSAVRERKYRRHRAR
jgi:hypothetical protein